MSEVSTITAGAFCWPELSTTDQKGAVAFYRSLFGWALEDAPMGPGETYSMFKVRGKNVGGAYTMRNDERAMGAPPHWNSYVAVANVDESTKKAKSLGAKVLAEPLDVMEAGRMSVLQDPTGAAICLWQAKLQPGAQVLGETGSLVWTELATRDPKAAEKFYSSLFGWTMKPSTNPNMQYTEIYNQGAGQGGILPITPEMGNMPPAWTPYFGVDDVDKTAAKAKESGGKVYMGPQDIPNVGRFAVLGDPQGAPFCVFKGAVAH